MDDQNQVLFEITSDHLETGMRAVPVGYCTTSSVDPHKGLFYVGRPVSELGSWSPEEVIYLLMKGEKGAESDVQAFSDELKKRAHCSEQLKQHICMLPKQGHPMALFSAAILIAGMLEGNGDYWEDALNLTAKLPEIVATLINYHAGWGEGEKSNPSLGYMENFTHMLNVPNVDKEKLGQALKVFNVLHYDHGGGNLSTFVGKAIASGKEDMYGSISGAMSALAGPLHGRANQDCLDFVKQVHTELGETISDDKVEELIRSRLANKQLVYGFGHAVLRVEDPRATYLYSLAEQLVPDHPLVRVALSLRVQGPKVLGENPKISNPYPNVDAISGTLLCALGFDRPEYFTVLFGLSRAVGIARQVIYERLEARNGKGTPIIRPKYFFKTQ
jgi:citrate synthase